MSPLALTYRPRRLSDLTGQPHISLVLATMLRRWQADELKLPTALLFTGPRGSGKTSTARIVAAYLNCVGTPILEIPDSHQPGRTFGFGATQSSASSASAQPILSQPAGAAAELLRPCLQCSSCQAIYRGSSPSVIEIDAASHGLVDDIRELTKVSRLSHQGACRVFVIDEVHSASREAFSALLKQLEEPPTGVMYILVTTEDHVIPSTIKSRCLAFTFQSIPEPAIVERLEIVARSESFVYDPATFPLLAYRAHGSLRDAMMLLEQLAILQDITPARFKSLWPDELTTFARSFYETALTNDPVQGIKLIRETFLIHRDVPLLTDSVIEHISDVILTHNTNGVAPQRLALLIRHAWDLRVRSRAFNPTDPILLEALWYLWAMELSGSSYATTPTLPIREQGVSNSSHKGPLPVDDLDQIFKGM